MSDALRQQVAGLLAQGQVPAARHALAQWHAQRPPSAESLHAEAMLAIAEGQLPLAAERLEQSLAAEVDGVSGSGAAVHTEVSPAVSSVASPGVLPFLPPPVPGGVRGDF